MGPPLKEPLLEEVKVGVRGVGREREELDDKEEEEEGDLKLEEQKLATKKEAKSKHEIIVTFNSSVNIHYQNRIIINQKTFQVIHCSNLLIRIKG